MDDVEVIADPVAAAVALEPIRSRLLAELATPASAATLATRLGMPRQKINYHVRTLEAHHLVREAQTRRWGGLTERLLVASAASYVVSPAALGAIAPDPARATDRLSAGYLVALASRAVREVGALLRGARRSGRPVATFSLDTEIRFRSPATRAAFGAELTQAALAIAARYHDEAAPDGRLHRLVMLAHPVPIEPTAKERSCQ
jgi:hypothetical protein